MGSIDILTILLRDIKEHTWNEIDEPRYIEKRHRVEASIRDWGEWKNPEYSEYSDYEEEDYDWKELSTESYKKLLAIVDNYNKEYNTKIEISIGEKNWIYFYIRVNDVAESVKDTSILESINTLYTDKKITSETYKDLLESIKEEIEDELFIESVNNSNIKKIMDRELEYYGFYDINYTEGKSLDELWDDFCYNNDLFPDINNLEEKEIFKDLMSDYVDNLSESVISEKYSKEEIDSFIGKTFNQRKILSIFKSHKYETPELMARTRCIRCENRKNVLLSNLINDPDKYGSCDCSKENISAIVDDIQDLYAGRKKLKNNTSGYTGVYSIKDKNDPSAPIKWRAYITLEGHRKYLGDFSSKTKAIEARKKAALNGIKYYKGYETKMLHNARDNKTTKSEKKRRSKLDIDNILGLDKDTDEE